MGVSPLFARYVDGFTIGELPKEQEKAPVHRRGIYLTDDQHLALGYVQTPNGWAHHAQCHLLPIGGKLTWVEAAEV